MTLAIALIAGPATMASANPVVIWSDILEAVTSGDTEGLEASLDAIDGLGGFDQTGLALALISLADSLAETDPAIAAQLLSGAAEIAANLAPSRPALTFNFNAQIVEILNKYPAIEEASSGTVASILQLVAAANDMPGVTDFASLGGPCPQGPSQRRAGQEGMGGQRCGVSDEPNITDPLVNLDLNPSPTTP